MFLLCRTVDQANAIKREAEKKHVVIVGTSFIGKGVKFKLLRFLFSATYNFVKTFCDMVRQTLIVSGMEVAASLVTSAASVTVIGKDPVPFFASLGEQVALKPCH